MIFRLLIIGQLSVICFCAKVVENTNPYDSDFKGEYGLILPFSEEDSPYKLLYDYTLTVTDTGKHALHTYTPSMSLNVEPPFKTTYEFTDNAVFMFTKTGECTFLVKGTAANGDTILRRSTFSVINPFKIIYDTASFLNADSIKFTIRDTSRMHSSLKNKLSVEWKCTWYKSATKKNILAETSDSLDFDSEFIVLNSENPAYITVSATLRDGDVQVPLDDSVNIDSLTPLIPTIYFRSDSGNSIMVTSGQPSEIQIFLTNTDYVDIFYKGDRRRIDTIDNTTSEYSLTFEETWDTSTNDTIVAQARNKHDMVSRPETLIVIPVNRSLWLRIDDGLPTVARVNEQTQWQVKVADKGGIIPDSLVEFFWRLSPFDPGLMDTSTSGGTLHLTFKDDVEKLLISVMAHRCDTEYEDGFCDSTLDTQVFVQAKSYRPTLNVTRSCDSVYVDSSCTFHLKAADDNSDGREGTVEQLLYLISSVPGDTVKTSIADSVTITLPNAKNDTVTIWCVDNDGFSSKPVRVPVTVYAFYPYFPNPLKTVTVFVDKANYLNIETVAGNRDDEIAMWEWDLDGDGAFDDTTETDSILFTGSKVDTTDVFVRCTNTRGDTSEDKAVITVIISDGPPQITAFTCTTSTTFINDGIECYLEAFDPNPDGKITAFKVYLNESDPIVFELGTPVKHLDTTFLFSIPSDTSIDSYMLSVQVTDNDSLSSTPRALQENISVSIGRPVVDHITPTTVWIKDDTIFTFVASDENGTVESYFYSIDGADFTKKSDSTITVVFEDSGSHELRVYVEDDDGLHSNILEQTVYVRYGQPKITDIHISPIPENRFINYDISFSVSAEDTNDTDLSISVSWNGDGTFGSPKDGMTNVDFDHSFSNNESGERTIQFRVTDSDGISSDTTIQITVRKGTPTVNIQLDTPAESLFVNDPIRFSISAYDINETVQYVIAKWNTGGINDTIFTGNDQDPSFEELYTFDTTGGPQTVTVWAVDNDGVVSESDEVTFILDQGEPRVFGDSGDTLFVIVDGGPDDYYYKPNYSDPNGEINTFYYGFTEVFANATASDEDSARIQIFQDDINEKAGDIFIWVRDDDSLIRGNRFIIFADSVPRNLSIADGPHTNDSVFIAWSGKDSLDQNNTNYAILWKLGGDPGPEDTLVSFRAGSTFASGSDIGGGFDFKYIFKPQDGAGTYRYRVIAKDVRGSTTESTIVNYPYNP